MTGLRESGKKIKKERKNLKAEGFKVAIEKLKQRISAKSEKLRQCLTQYNQ